MFAIRREDIGLLQPGIRVCISSELKGSEIYGGEDPEWLEKWCGKEVTIREISPSGDFPVGIEEEYGAWFCVEEVEFIVNDVDIEESDESIEGLFGGMS